MNKTKIDFLSLSENESFARTAAAAFVSALDPTIEEMSDIKTAVSEAVTNSIIHGYEGNAGVVTLTITIKDKLVTIEITDSGQGIDNISQAMRPLYTSKPHMERSGMGFTVMENFMDSLSVTSEPGKGTKVIMTKRIL